MVMLVSSRVRMVVVIGLFFWRVSFLNWGLIWKFFRRWYKYWLCIFKMLMKGGIMFGDYLEMMFFIEVWSGSLKWYCKSFIVVWSCLSFMCCLIGLFFVNLIRSMIRWLRFVCYIDIWMRKWISFGLLIVIFLMDIFGLWRIFMFVILSVEIIRLWLESFEIWISVLGIFLIVCFVVVL